MRRVRTLIADDSETMRAALTAVLGADPGIDIVGSVADGMAVVEAARRLRPDVITMDVLMPGRDGLSATAEIMATAPTRVVVVASVAQERQADLSFRAIAAGALEAVAKPAGPAADLRRWGEQMCRTVRLLSEVPVITRRAGVRGARALPSSAGKVDVLGIAASTGGPPALAQLLGGLPASLPVPLLIAQHLTPGFTAGLVRWLNEAAALTVEIARAGELPRPGTAYVAPDGCHLEVDPEGHLLTPRAIGAGPVPDANRLFESLAVAWGDRAGGLVLTGMGEDGATGLASLSLVGGVALVQDEESSLVYGMPAAARARCPGAQQLALDQMSSFLTVLAGTPFSFQPREPSTR